MKIRVAAAQYPIDAIASWQAFEDKLARWFKEAQANRAELLVFPEYGAMELAYHGGAAVRGNLQASIDHVGSLRGRVDALHAEFARAHGVHVLASSLPERQADGTAHNVARLISPEGSIAEQRKLVMTRFERETWHISGTRDINVFETRLGRIGVAICYDAEFPLIARAMSEAGATTILVPSCTDAPRGYHRVRVAARARALENQCYVVQSPTIGAAPWSPAVDANHGAAGVFGPPDLGFPEDGVVASGRENEPQWVFADLDLDAVVRVRREGAVFNDRHWVEQPGAPALSARVVRL
jgi:predicted amidohydrolase